MLAERFGYHGFFTFHRTGWAAYLDYLMVESSKKPAHDLDREMVFYPSSYTREKAEAELQQMSAQAAGRRKNDKVQRCQTSRQTPQAHDLQRAHRFCSGEKSFHCG
jgi:hypothetical protein